MNSQFPLIPPSAEDTRFCNLPKTAREEVRAWVSAFARNPFCAPVQEWCEDVAATVSRSLRRDVSPRTVRRMRDKLANASPAGDWFALVDPRRLTGCDPTTNGTSNPRFRDYWKRLVEKHNRSTRAAHRSLLRIWEGKTDRIPGYEKFPGWPDLPRGWSYHNLLRLAPTKAEVIAMRRGLVTARARLPQLYTTRVGLWPGAFLQFDDVWHDNLVTYQDRVTRVLEFGALDVFSGCRFAWGNKPRMPKVKQDDKAGREQMRNLSEKEFRLFLCSVLWNHGYSSNGTFLVVERGTASISERVEKILEEDTGGLVKVLRAGIEGKQQAVLKMWEGRGKGNPRHKSHLESLHNLMHNELGFVSGQLGLDYKHQPETTGFGGSDISKMHGLAKYQQWLLNVAKEMPRERAELLQHPLLDYHSQFTPLLDEIYRRINSRQDHALEGWHDCGNVAKQYTLAPESNHWTDIERLPDTTRAMVLAAASEEPERWSRTVRLSPAQVWERGRENLIKISPFTIIDILAPDYVETMKVRGGYFVAKRVDISPEPLRFEARVITSEGELKELADGDTWNVILNPYDPEFLFVLDSGLRCVGVAARDHAVNMLDFEKLKAAFGLRNKRTAERLKGIRRRHFAEQQAVGEMKKANAKVVGGNPVTVEEISAAKTIASDKGGVTSAASGMSEHERAGNLSAMAGLPAGDPPPAPAAETSEPDSLETSQDDDIEEINLTDLC